MYWIAKYFILVKTMAPPITGTTMVDTIVWAFLLIPIIASLALKILFRVVF